MEYFYVKKETYHHTIGSKANMEYLSIMEIFAHELAFIYQVVVHFPNNLVNILLHKQIS